MLRRDILLGAAVPLLYAFASATGNNGSSFAGLSTNTPFYNTVLVAAMAMGGSST